MRFVSENQKVYVKINGKWLLCVVVCAMGDTARIANELYGIDAWFNIDELRSFK